MLLPGQYLVLDCGTDEPTCFESPLGSLCGKRWASIAEAVRRTGLTRHQVSKGMRDGSIPAYRTPQQVNPFTGELSRVERYVLLDWIEEMERRRA